MARIFTESFEAGHTLRFTTINGPVIDTTSLIDGVNCVRLDGTAFVQKTFTAAMTEVYVGMFWRPTNVNVYVLQWLSSGGTVLGGVQRNSVTNVLELYTDTGTVVASSSASFSNATIYHLQVRFVLSDTVGVITVKADETQVVTFSGDTKPGADATFNTLQWGRPAGGGQQFIDALVVNDTSGAVDNTWPGILRFARMLPVGPGFYVDNWSRNAGASNWEAVDEVPPDGDTTYLYTTTANLYESFSMADQALVNVNYRALLTTVVAKKDSGTVQLAVGIRDDQNSTNYFGANSALGTSYGVVEERRTVDPSTGVAFTSAGINATQALIVSTTG